MIYLGDGISVPSMTYNFMFKEPPKRFLRWLAIEIWGEKNLVNRALQVKRVNRKPLPNRSPCKQIEKELLRLFLSVFYDYTEKRQDLPQKERIEAIRNATVVIVLRHFIFFFITYLNSVWWILK
ncbi:uncharacterized protein LOC103318170 [Nasonia vitripennis]|uniref:Uncharacterized protein n=1 Tax=Nasonia vitripennis TaxID=7425 RepID=A0A7M7QBI7_NASVI|nr:uncharacterized protein LOC103318170 [Nasonia vitripennis]